MSARPVAIIDAETFHARHFSEDFSDHEFQKFETAGQRVDEGPALCRPGVEDANGVDHPAELWVGSEHQGRPRNAQLTLARALCARCEVLDDCRELAALHAWSGVVIAGEYVRGTSAGGAYPSWSDKSVERRRQKRSA
jgi:hypothetical protein